mgnify:CR=1 FL=1
MTDSNKKRKLLESTANSAAVVMGGQDTKTDAAALKVGGLIAVTRVANRLWRASQCSWAAQLMLPDHLCAPGPQGCDHLDRNQGPLGGAALGQEGRQGPAGRLQEWWVLSGRRKRRPRERRVFEKAATCLSACCWDIVLAGSAHLSGSIEYLK